MKIRKNIFKIYLIILLHIILTNCFYDGYGQRWLNQDNQLCEHDYCCNNSPCLITGFFVGKDFIFLGSKDGIYRSEDSGNKYKKIFPGESYDFGSEDFSLEALFINQFQVTEKKIYVASNNGLFISIDAGESYSRITTEEGLGHNIINGISIFNDTIYAATEAGLSISDDGGSNFINQTTNEGLPENKVLNISVDNNTITLITSQGLSISIDNGNTYSLIKTENIDPDFEYWDDDKERGKIINSYLNGNIIISSLKYSAYGEITLYISRDYGNSFQEMVEKYGLNLRIHNIFALENNYYLSSYNGLFISTDGSKTFSRYDEENGLGCEYISAVTEYNGVIFVITEGYTRNYYPNIEDIKIREIRRFLSISYDGGESFINKEIKLYTKANYY
jgi:photosystem II stability/assembly factor-like uncharacterized protein